jgi:hypothetical protein
MVASLAAELDNFPGEANMTRCFLHIVNLIAKTLIRVFDIPGTSKKRDELDKAEMVLRDLAENLEVELYPPLDSISCGFATYMTSLMPQFSMK